MPYCVACIGPVGHADQGLYPGPEQARDALDDKLLELRIQHPGDAEEIDRVREELTGTEELITYFHANGEEWVAWMYAL